MEAALLLRAGFAEFAEKEYGQRVMPAADRLRGKSLADFRAAACQMDGRDMPTTESFGLSADRNYLGVSYRAYHDFGFALGDSKAAVKSAGS